MLSGSRTGGIPGSGGSVVAAGVDGAVCSVAVICTADVDGDEQLPRTAAAATTHANAGAAAVCRNVRRRPRGEEHGMSWPPPAPAGRVLRIWKENVAALHRATTSGKARAPVEKVGLLINPVSLSNITVRLPRINRSKSVTFT